jgi:hypothetical protein
MDFYERVAFLAEEAVKDARRAAINLVNSFDAEVVKSAI